MIRFVEEKYVKRDGPIDSFAPLRSPEDAIELLSEVGHTRAEFFRDNLCTKFYFDYDAKLPCKADAMASMERHLGDVRASMDAFITVLSVINPDVSYVIAKRHGPITPTKEDDNLKYKLSFRVFVSGIAIVYHRIWDVINDVPELRIAMASPCWDRVPYCKSSQLLCAILGRKTSEDVRMLEPLEPISKPDLLKYVASYIDPEWPVVDTSILDDEEIAADCRKRNTKTNTPNGPDADSLHIANLVACLGDCTAANRKEWLAVAFVLKGLDGGGDRHLDTWLRFSEKGGASYEGEADCINTWRSLQSRLEPGARLVTMGTLCFFAKRDDPERYRAWRRADHALRESSDQEMEVEVDSAEHAELVSSLARLDVVKEGELVKLTTMKDGLRFEGVDNSGVIRTEDMKVYLANGRYVGPLQPEFIVNKSLGFLHRDVPAAASSYTYSTVSETSALLKAPEYKTEIGLYDDTVAKINVAGKKEGSVENVNKLHKVHDIVRDALAASMVTRFGPATMNLFNNFGTVNNLLVEHNATERARADDELSAAWLEVFNAADAEEQGVHRIVKSAGDAYYCFDVRRGVWVKEVDQDHVCNHLLASMKTVSGGTFFDSLSDADKKYVGSIRGGSAVLRRSKTVMRDFGFEARLDTNMRLLPFTDGVYDLDAKVFRPLRWGDYVTKTIGYAFGQDVDPEDVEFVKRFYEQVLPVEEEREVMLRMAGSSVGGMPINKKFLVGQDVRGGNNGKSMCARSFQLALGDLCGASNCAFLAANSRPDPNGHTTALMDYVGKRLAIFDETDPAMRFDLAKLKAITGGAPIMTGRSANEGVMTKFRWTAFIMIACNEGCFPQLDSTDVAFVNRIVAMPFRSKFNDAEAAAGTPLSFPVDLLIDKKLEKARAAVMRVLIAAFERYEADGLSFGVIPPGCLALRTRLLEASDPKLELINAVIEREVDLNPSPTKNAAGRPILSYVERSELVARIKLADKGHVLTCKEAKTKELVDNAMAALGRPLTPKTNINGQQLRNVFGGCSINP
jgi:hypothetical protein